MKYFLYTFAIALICACKKDTINTGLHGKWRLTESWASSGGPMEKTLPDPHNPFFIEFKANGEYVNRSNPDFANRFTIDSNTVTLIGARSYVLNYTVENGILTLVPKNPICIEGCYSKYISVR